MQVHKDQWLMCNQQLYLCCQVLHFLGLLDRLTRIHNSHAMALHTLLMSMLPLACPFLTSWDVIFPTVPHFPLGLSWLYCSNLVMWTAPWLRGWNYLVSASWRSMAGELPYIQFHMKCSAHLMKYNNVSGLTHGLKQTEPAFQDSKFFHQLHH